jgi:hypothetical protein
MILIFEEFAWRHQICLGDDNIFYVGEVPLFSKFEMRFPSHFFLVSPNFMTQNKVIVGPIKEWGPYKLIRTFKSLVIDCNNKLKKNNMWH